MKAFFDILNIVPIVALAASSSFFITLLLVMLFAKNQVFNDAVILLGFSIIFTLYRVIHKTEKYLNWFLWVGSLSFFLFAGGFLLKKSFFVSILDHYKYLEGYLNRTLVENLIGILFILLIFIILVKLLSLVFTLIQNRWVKFIIGIFSCVMVFIVIRYVIDQYQPFLREYFGVMKNYLLPILGVSIAYVHGNFIVTRLLKLFHKQ